MQSRLERWAPLTGIGYFVLYAVGFLVMGSSPDFVSDPKEYLTYYTDHKSDVLIGGVALLLAAFLLLWFLGSIRRASLAAEGGDGRVTSIGFAGGAVGVALLLSGIAATMLPALRLDNDQKLTVETATTFQDLGSALVGLAAPIGYAAVVFSVTVVGLRHGLVHKVWAWISALLGVVMLIPFISWAGAILLFPIWVLVTSILLLLRARGKEAARAASAA
jgi:hypothetical protein